jgi:hypothetical protein
VVPVGDRSQSYELGLGDTIEGRAAFLDLANMPLTPEGVLWFVRHWGLLDRLLTVLDYYAASVSIAGAIREAETPNGFGKIAKFLESWRGSDGAPRFSGLGFVGTKFGWTREVQSKPYLLFQATSLLQYCWFDLMQAHNGGADVTCCPAPGCGKFLAKRSGGRHKEHCSDACRQAARRARLVA